MGQRRRSLVRNHHLDGGAATAEEVTRSVVALHATDPATVYLSVLARSRATTLADVADATYERRTLVRWLAMRRTLWVVPVDDVPMIQAAVGADVAARLQGQLVSRLERNGSEPAITGDLRGWLTAVEDSVERLLKGQGPATGAQLRTGCPDLQTLIHPGTPSERAQYLASPLLTHLSARGRIVRAEPTGTWTSRHHRWEPVERWWPDGFPDVDPATARMTLARRWLECFGPATADDLQWWTGWNRTTTAAAIAAIDTEPVDLHGEPGIDLAGRDPGPSDGQPVAALLPSLDPTPMGWKHRDWYVGVERHHLFDRAGNIGPTLWWNGEIIGGWATTAGGDLRWSALIDRGAEARHAIDRAAGELQQRLAGTVVTPAARTPLERSLQDPGS